MKATYQRLKETEKTNILHKPQKEYSYNESQEDTLFLKFILVKNFDVFLTVRHSIGLFLQPTLMHNSITTCMSHYYPRHVSGLDMPILGGTTAQTQHLVSSLS